VVAAAGPSQGAGGGEPGFDPRRDVSLEEPADAACTRGEARLETSSPGQEAYDAWCDGNGYLVARASYARGWTAFVDGQPARVLRANRTQRAVALQAGSHKIVFRYEPPGLRAGIGVMLVAAVSAIAIWLRPSWPKPLSAAADSR
jgi:hypothetical protein